MSAPPPILLTPLVGRDEELTWLSACIEGSERLITLFGPPGVGKTRLAVEALEAARAAGTEAYFCSLVDARTEDDVALHVLRTVLHGDVASGVLKDAALAALSARGPTVVVLDGFEHLTGVAVRLLSAWVAACVNVSFVLTSREVLRIPGEVARELGPLRRPQDGSELETAPASRLLLDSLARYRPNVTLDEDDRTILADIVRRLEGLPLALEIVAPRIALLGLRLVHERLESVLSFSHRGMATSGRTLRETIAWSWALLSDEERTTLAYCSVFRDGFTLEALEAVALPEGTKDRSRVLSLLMALRDKSLTHVPPEGGASRFGTYASIGEYAAEQLEAMGLREEAERRHRRYFARAVRTLTERDRPDALRVLRFERGNLKAVLERGIASRDVTRDGELRADVLAVLTLFQPPYFFGETRARLVPLIDEAFAVLGEQDDVLSARVLLAKGVLLAYVVHTHTEGIAALERALAIARAHGERSLEAHILSYLATALPGEPQAVIARFREAEAIAREGGDRSILAHVLSWLAITLCNNGDSDLGLATAREAIACAADPAQIVRARSLCAAVCLARGDLALAEADIRVALDEASRHGYYAMEAEALMAHATARHMAGAIGEAESAYRTAIARFDELGRAKAAAGLRMFLALVLFEAGETNAALDEARRAEPLLDEAFDDTRPPALAHAVVEMARARLAGGRAEDEFFEVPVASAEAAAALARLGVVAALEAAQRAHASKPGSGDALARDARARLEELRRDAPPGSSVERALVDGIAQRFSQRWTEPVLPAGRTFVVSLTGDWFRTPAGELVSCEERHVLRRLLAALAAARRDAPGVPVPIEELRAVGWPDERMSPESARNRLKQSMAVLRRLGLGEALQRAPGGGYLLSPEALRLE